MYLLNGRNQYAPLAIQEKIFPKSIQDSTYGKPRQQFFRNDAYMSLRDSTGRTDMNGSFRTRLNMKNDSTYHFDGRSIVSSIPTLRRIQNDVYSDGFPRGRMPVEDTPIMRLENRYREDKQLLQQQLNEAINAGNANDAQILEHNLQKLESLYDAEMTKLNPNYLMIKELRALRQALAPAPAAVPAPRALIKPPNAEEKYSGIEPFNFGDESYSEYSFGEMFDGTPDSSVNSSRRSSVASLNLDSPIDDDDEKQRPSRSFGQPAPLQGTPSAGDGLSFVDVIMNEKDKYGNIDAVFENLAENVAPLEQSKFTYMDNIKKYELATLLESDLALLPQPDDNGGPNAKAQGWVKQIEQKIIDLGKRMKEIDGQFENIVEGVAAIPPVPEDLKDYNKPAEARVRYIDETMIEIIEKIEQENDDPSSSSYNNIVAYIEAYYDLRDYRDSLLNTYLNKDNLASPEDLLKVVDSSAPKDFEQIIKYHSLVPPATGDGSPTSPLDEKEPDGSPTSPSAPAIDIDEFFSKVGKDRSEFINTVAIQTKQNKKGIEVLTDAARAIDSVDLFLKYLYQRINYKPEKKPDVEDKIAKLGTFIGNFYEIEEEKYDREAQYKSIVQKASKIKNRVKDILRVIDGPKKAEIKYAYNNGNPRLRYRGGDYIELDPNMGSGRSPGGVPSGSSQVSSQFDTSTITVIQPAQQPLSDEQVLRFRDDLAKVSKWVGKSDFNSLGNAKIKYDSIRVGEDLLKMLINDLQTKKEETPNLKDIGTDQAKDFLKTIKTIESELKDGNISKERYDFLFRTALQTLLFIYPKQ